MTKPSWHIVRLITRYTHDKAIMTHSQVNYQYTHDKAIMTHSQVNYQYTHDKAIMTHSQVNYQVQTWYGNYGP